MSRLFWKALLAFLVLPGSTRNASNAFQNNRLMMRRASFVFGRIVLPPRDGLPQHVLDLTVDAAQLVCRPSLDLFPELGRQTKQEGLALFSHDAGR